jgi:predicted dienelactone hydrolase
MLGVASAPGHAAASVVVPPLPLPGPYPVACSNVAQDFSRLAPGEPVQDYWEGFPRDNGTSRYVTDLLSDPANTLALTVNVPSDGDLYGSFAGRAVAYVVLVCYPTAPDNPRPDYALPTGRSVPRMQRGAEAPLLLDATARFPLLLFSHGSEGSPLSSDYIDAITLLASYGYVVAAPFHGDARVANLSLNSLSDVGYVLLHLRDLLALQALRPLSLSATIDLLLAHPQWRDHIDPAQIGGFGASLGGEAMLLMAGAGLTKSFGLSWSTVIKDARLRAAVGYVPYFGQPFLPAFGRGEHGLDDITLPFLAISGTADTTAPIVTTQEGMNRLAGTRELVTLVGVNHGFDVASTNDIYTWTLTFLDSEVRGDPAARGRLLSMTSVAGGGDDHVVIAYNGPASPNYGGLWWNAPAGSESGWGLNVAHQGDVIFATWMTYSSNGQPWWLSMTAALTGPGVYSGPLYETRGPAFDALPFSPTDVTATAVGSGTLTFGDANNGSFAYIANGVQQTKSITRQVFGPLPTCKFGTQPDLSLATNYQDLWWAAPAGIEAGWGTNLTHQGDLIFANWFTYDRSHAPLWLSATAAQTAPGTYSGTIYRTTGPAFSAVPFDPNQVGLTSVGTVTLTFANGNDAMFAYTVNGVSQSKPITRQVFRAPGTVCQ